MTGLLEAFAPRPDAFEVHRIEVDAPPDVVYRALWTVDFARSPVVAGLLGLRALPSLLRRRAGRPPSRRLTLTEIQEAGFGTLAERPGREIVLGVSGRFWRLTGNVEPFDPEAFSLPVPAGMAQGVWSFRVLPRGDRGSLSTETRVTCGDPGSRAKSTPAHKTSMCSDLACVSGRIQRPDLATNRAQWLARICAIRYRIWGPG